jgi:hypothetical protein
MNRIGGHRLGFSFPGSAWERPGLRLRLFWGTPRQAEPAQQGVSEQSPGTRGKERPRRPDARLRGRDGLAYPGWWQTRDNCDLDDKPTLVSPVD